LATLSVTFVGFSALVIILRQTLGGQMSRLDVLITRIFIQLGFMVAAGSMLPPLLTLFDISELHIWRTSSLVIAVPSSIFACTYPWRRRVASGVSTPIGVWIDVWIMVLLSLLLYGNAADAFVPREAGAFAAALTGILFVAGWAYLQALNTLLRHHQRSRVTDNQGLPPLAEGR
jgi:hypothetical protein